MCVYRDLQRSWHLNGIMMLYVWPKGNRIHGLLFIVVDLFSLVETSKSQFSTNTHKTLRKYWTRETKKTTRDRTTSKQMTEMTRTNQKRNWNEKRVNLTQKHEQDTDDGHLVKFRRDHSVWVCECVSAGPDNLQHSNPLNMNTSQSPVDNPRWVARNAKRMR